jgi:DNA-directed RNA polymerase subunit H (RpoH/RPB5)
MEFIDKIFYINLDKRKDRFEQINTELQKMNFPDISRFDPVARAIGIRPGDVCHIIRPSKTAIEADYYRICI